MSKPVLSSSDNMKFFTGKLTEAELVNCLSDLKHRIFPRPFERLSSLSSKVSSDDDGGGLIGVEIGVAGGEHALSLLQSLDIKKIYLIDPYEHYPEYYEGKLHYGVEQSELELMEKLAKELLSEYSDKIVWIKEKSAVAINLIKEKVDFVYIDGNHQYEYILEDIDSYYPIIKQLGVLGGHDYYNGFQREHDSVVNVVNSFVIRNKLQLRTEMPDWWIDKPVG